jgi:hypothetical protein
VLQLSNLVFFLCIFDSDSIIHLIENATQFLHIPILREIIQTLLTRQLGSLSFSLNQDILNCMEQPEFYNYCKLTLFLFSKSSLKQKLSSSVEISTQKIRQWNLWQNVVKNIVFSLELPNNKEFLHYCRNVSNTFFLQFLSIVLFLLKKKFYNLQTPVCVCLYYQ